MTRIFTFILLVAVIGCTFAEDVDHQRKEEIERSEQHEEVGLGGLRFGKFGISNRWGGFKDKKPCLPHGYKCGSRMDCCDGMHCRMANSKYVTYRCHKPQI